MNFSDILDQVRLGKGSAKSHIRNLIEIAAADGNLGDEELRLLEHVASKNHITPAELSAIRADPGSQRFKAPSSDREKFSQLYDLVHMMSVDEDVNAEEMRLCEIFALKFGYRKEAVREMIEMLRVHIKAWKSPEDALREITGKLRIHD